MSHKILVIDDEESIRFTFERFLTAEGFKVKTAKGFAEALAELSAETFDLVFADIILGGQTGIDLLRVIRDRDKTCPVVLITGYPDVGTAAEAVRLGAYDYIIKPVEKEILLTATRKAIEQKAFSDKVERRQRNLEAIFKVVHDPIIAVDENLRVIDMNEAATRLLGACSAVAGKPFHPLAMGCCTQCRDALERTIATGDPVEIPRVECRITDKVKRVVNLRTSPLLDGKGGVFGAVLVHSEESRIQCGEEGPGPNGCMNLVGRSAGMQRVYTLVEQLADAQSTVLLTGESGTGKELVAEALHFKGSRKGKPYIKVNLTSLPETLVESELFGHVKGAFTGAHRDKHGRFQLADGGTLLLDEIGDLSQRVQVSLLRVLQEREFERVGDHTPIRVDVRVIAATNQDLRVKIERGEFREDLYYRLKVVEIQLPPLREKKEDIPLLVDHFIKQFNQTMEKRIGGVSEDVLRVFMDYDWPGNVRELKHTIEHGCLLCSGNILTLDDLPPDFGVPQKDTKSDLHKVAGESEIQAIMRALEKTGGNRSSAARLLGMSRRTIYRKIEEYGLSEETAAFRQ
jgi:DNA-binding NtrC family response regulator